MAYLYVPIQIEALVVGTEKQRVRNMQDTFSALEKSPLGESVRVETYNTKELRPGVHLHFIMPDRLLQGLQRDDGNEIDFPILPDRWIIQRLEKKTDGKIEKKAWRIVSNVVHPYDYEENYGSSSVTFPMYTKSDGVWRPAGPLSRDKKERKSYGYVGHCELLTEDSNFEEPDDTIPLTAVGWGDPCFAAAYQKCASSFGFWDRLKEEEETEYTYVVCGYYARKEEDPVWENYASTKELWEKAAFIEKELSWKMIDDDNGIIPENMICHGTVCNVYWPGRDKYIEGGVPKGEVEIAVGHNSAEALAALMQNKYPEDRGMERLLLYQQQDTWKKIQRASGDDLLEAEEEAHQKQFFQVVSGYRYELERTDEKEAFDSLEEKDYKILERLNDLEEKLEKGKYDIQSCSQRIYAFWCKCISLYNRERDSSIYELQIYIDEMKNAQEKYQDGQKLCDELEREIQKCRQQLENNLCKKKNLRVVKKEMTRGYQPNPPVIAVHGEGVSRSFRQGFQTDSDGLLPCRLQTVTRKLLEDAQKEQARVFSIDDVQKHIIGKLEVLPEFCEFLTAEAILLDPSLQQILWMDKEERGINETEEGEIPFSISFKQWEQPWNPMELVWEVSFKTFISDFEENCILDNFFLGDIDFESKKESGQYDRFSASGSTLLTPNAANIMGQRFQSMFEDKKTLAISIERQDTLSQQLEGFRESCLGMHDTLQIPVYWKKWDEVRFGISLESLQRCVQTSVFEPDTGKYTQYLPVCSGVGEVTRLWIVDSFGQIKEVQSEKYNAKVHIAESLMTADPKKFFLAPRFLLPCTIRTKWITSKEGLRDAASPETTPICGFVRPDLIHKIVTFYDHRGDSLGRLQIAGEKCHFTSLNENIRTISDISNGVVFRLIERLSQSSAAFREFLEYLGLYFEHFLEEEGTNFYQLCFGRVLALAQISINITAVGDYARCFQNGSIHFETNGYEKCKFLVRMGDERKCRDGLAGFFVSDTQSYLPDMSVMSACDLQAARFGKEFIHPQRDWEHTLDRPAQNITVLFDPFSNISIRTGLLPELTLKLEEYFFKDAVDKIQTVFPVWPLIHSSDEVQMPLPEAEIGSWKWLDAGGEEYNTNNISAVNQQEFYNGNRKIREGYVKVQRGESDDKF